MSRDVRTYMVVSGEVRSWGDEQGWGVVDSPETPGGCWTHFSHVAVDGYRSLAAGQRVQLEWEPADQDGYSFRAVRVWLEGTVPVEPPVAGVVDGAYRSELIITFNEDHKQD